MASSVGTSDSGNAELEAAVLNMELELQIDHSVLNVSPTHVEQQRSDTPEEQILRTGLKHPPPVIRGCPPQSLSEFPLLIRSAEAKPSSCIVESLTSPTVISSSTTPTASKSGDSGLHQLEMVINEYFERPNFCADTAALLLHYGHVAYRYLDVEDGHTWVEIVKSRTDVPSSVPGGPTNACRILFSCRGNVKVIGLGVLLFEDILSNCESAKSCLVDSIDKYLSEYNVPCRGVSDAEYRSSSSHLQHDCELLKKSKSIYNSFRSDACEIIHNVRGRRGDRSRCSNCQTALVKMRQANRIAKLNALAQKLHDVNL